MIDLMIDIETLGTSPDAIVIGIAAVLFNSETGEIIQRRFWMPNQRLQEEAGRTMDKSTLIWWGEQIGKTSNPMKDRLLHMVQGSDANKEMASDILDDLIQIAAGCDGYFWCKGVGFDFPILKSYFKSFGLESPFESNGGFRRQCDSRQLRIFWERLTGEKYTPLPNDLTPHNPMDDCLIQIAEVCDIWKKLKN